MFIGITTKLIDGREIQINLLSITYITKAEDSDNAVIGTTNNEFECAESYDEFIKAMKSLQTSPLLMR